ncbi:MAG: hypothetical protein WDO70_04395 [Alphaproteobacteria bacterium]
MKSMKLPSAACFFFILLGVLLYLIQLWFQVWSHEIFSKIMVTDIAVFIIVYAFSFFIKEDKATDKINNDKNGLD